MSKGNTTENDILKKIFNDTDLSWDANENLYVSLHTADPGEGGDQTTYEASYTPYARIAIARTAEGWTVAGNTSSNTALIQFAQCASGSDTITHVAIGTTSTGTGQILYSGQLNSSIAVAANVQPQFAIAALQIQED